MNKLFACLIPCIFILSFIYATRKKVNVYEAFTGGAKDAIPLVVTIFPYIATVLILTELFSASGLESKFLTALSPVFDKLGIPEEIAPLLLVKPLSGNGSLAVLSDILNTYGADAYLSRCACVIYGSSETTLYLGAIYFSGLKRKRLTSALMIALISFLLSAIFGCFVCRFL
ncbi:MAG: spore maturation protein [Clostridia bacterium]|nr:spore maturation protein [Clostridia bacterium]